MSAASPVQEAEIRRILDARTEELASRSGAPSGPGAARPSRAMLVCAVGAERYGIELSAAAAVLPARPCTPAPGAPAALVGLFGRAGVLYQALDLAALLGLPPSAPPAGSDQRHLVVLRRKSPRAALQVDRVLGTAPALIGEAEAAARPLLGDGPVFGYARAPAGTLEPGETGFALIDLDRLLRPFILPLPASGA